MKHFTALTAAVLALAATTAADADGLVALKSPYPAKETMNTAVFAAMAR